MNRIVENTLSEDWIVVGPLAAIPVRGARVVKSRHGDIAVFRAEDDTVFALRNRCPHRGGPLSEGIVHGHTVTCPLHGFVVDLASGAVEAPDDGCVRAIGVRVADGVVALDVAGLAAED